MGASLKERPRYKRASMPAPGNRGTNQRQPSRPNTTLTLFGNKVPLCPEHSCRSKCNFPNPSMQICYCDRYCKSYGDCCIDYEAVCEGTTSTANPITSTLSADDGSTHLPDYEESLKRRILNDIKMWNTECVPVFDAFGKTLNKLLVRSCPEETANGLRRLCEEDIKGNITTKALVVDTEKVIFYLNKYCAQCNGISLESNILASVPFVIFCGNHSVEASEIFATKGLDAFLAFAATYCQLNYDFDMLPFVIDRYDRIAFHEHCGNDDVVNKCKDSAVVTDEVKAACEAYLSPVKTDAASTKYKNPFCAICDANGVELDETWECLRKEFGTMSQVTTNGNQLPSFSILLDLTGQSNDINLAGRKLCPKDAYLDVAHDVCMQKNCPVGEITLQDTCVKLNVTVEQILENMSLPMLSIFVAFRPTLSSGFNESMGIENVHNMLRKQFSAGGSESPNMTQVKCIDSHSVFWQNFSLGLNETSLAYENLTCVLATFQDSSKLQLHQVLQDVKEAKRIFYSAVSQLKIFSFSLMNVHPHSNLSCLEGSNAVYNEPVIAFNAVPEQVDHEKSARDKTAVTEVVMAMVNETSISYELQHVPWVFQWITEDNLGNMYSSFSIKVCEPDIIHCDKVMFEPHEFWTENGGVMVKIEGHVVSVQDSSKFIIHKSQQLVICAELILEEVRKLGPGQDTFIEGVLTLIGIALSLCGLFCTLIVYCILPSLRTTPGKCIMNLSAALFVAQLSFEVSPTVAIYPIACKLLAALQHFTWLAAFCWMNVLAYDLCRTFGGNGMDAGRSQAVAFRIYMVYAWGLPLLMVALCLGIDFGTLLPFAYGSRAGCWITGRDPLLYSFALPLAAIIISNLVLFIRTVVAIRHTMKIAAKAKTNKSALDNLLLNLKLFCLMGFTWVFGFLSNFTGLQSLNYIFIALNTVQGVFIFMSFVMTSRVRRMLLAKAKGEEFTTSTMGTVSSKLSTSHNDNGNTQKTKDDISMNPETQK